MLMTNSDAIVEAEFVRFIINGELDKIKEAFDSFSSHLISFIHKPVHWVEKHHCLVRLNAIFHVHNLQTKCETVNTYIALALSLIETMKELLMEAQKNCMDALTSLKEKIVCANGQNLEWSDGTGAAYELCHMLHAKGAFNKGEAELGDITRLVESILNMGLTPDGCYEFGRQMKKRKGRKGAPMYDIKLNIESRSYWTDDCRRAINDRMIRQDMAGDGLSVK